MESKESSSVKQEPSERANLIKALEENLKAVVEQGTDDEELDAQLEEAQESENEDEPMDEEDLDEMPVKKEPKPHKTIKQYSQAPQGPLPASYIMKLFDRSVNLAQFEEDTPLYPLCRSWMKNQPRATINNRSVEKGNDPLDVQEAQDGDVVEMPKVRIRKGKTPARSEVRINKKELDQQINAKNWTRQKLLDEHQSHWREERARQAKTAQNFSEKYFAANLELLESLIKESEE